MSSTRKISIPSNIAMLISAFGLGYAYRTHEYQKKSHAEFKKTLLEAEDNINRSQQIIAESNRLLLEADKVLARGRGEQSFACSESFIRVKRA